MKISSKTVDVLLVDDHALFLSGIKALLEKEEIVGEVKEAKSAEEALEMLNEYRVDVVLMDIGLPGMDGITATQFIKEKQPFIKIIMLTMHDDEPYLFKAMEANASGYILKEAASTELVSAIHDVMEGEIVIHPRLVKVLVKGARKESEGEVSGTGNILTEREKEVLQYVCLGYTNQEIADLLIVSPKTVEKHKSNIMEKLNLTRRHELVRYALENGLVNLGKSRGE